MNDLHTEKNRRVLIIDDNRAIHDDFKKILAPGTEKAAALDAAEMALFGSPTSLGRLIQFELDSAHQGQEGVLLVKKALEAGRPYAMAFVDIRMPPGWDGVVTTQKLWEIDPQVQIVICTAYSDYSWNDMFEKIGHRDGLVILKKPFDTVEVLQLAHALTEKWWLHQQSMRKLEELETRVGERTRELFQANHALQSEVAEHKEHERQLRLATGELERANRNLVDRNTEIQSFYHTLSHELKTPLTAAREFVSIVMDGLAGPLNATQSEYLGIAKQSCDQLRLYVNDLLDVTRLETGKMSLEFQAAPLAVLVEQVVKMLAPAAVGKGLSLSCDCQPDLPDAPIDKHRILQVLTNLTTNAIKFTPAGGQIRLSLCEAPMDPECFQLSVQDTGRGIAREQLELVFNRLYQAHHDDPSAESRSGLGLGLYICRELVGLHGGRIWVESEPGRGSTFTFTVPRCQKPTTVNVLVVDDDERVRNYLRDLLEKQGYRVSLARDGTEALDRMRHEMPTLVILDLSMPHMDGADTLKQIRQLARTIPVIVHTGHPEGDLMARAMEFSPFTLLSKPSTAESMLNTVRALARGIAKPLGKADATEVKPATSEHEHEKDTRR